MYIILKKHILGYLVLEISDNCWGERPEIDRSEIGLGLPMDPVKRGEWNGQWFQDKPQPQVIREAEGPVLEMSEDGDATLHHGWWGRSQKLDVGKDKLHMERVVDEAIEMHASMREVDDNFHGSRRGGEDRDDNFNAHLENVLNTLESRVQDHDGQTVQGELMQRMEVLLASHGIFDAAVVSALVPLCNEISPQLGQTLSKFRQETADIITGLSNCCSQLEQHLRVSSTTSSTSSTSGGKRDNEERVVEQALPVPAVVAVPDRGVSGRKSSNSSVSSRYGPLNTLTIQAPAPKPGPRIHPGRHINGDSRGRSQGEDGSPYRTKRTKIVRQSRVQRPRSQSRGRSSSRGRHEESPSSSPLYLSSAQSAATMSAFPSPIAAAAAKAPLGAPNFGISPGDHGLGSPSSSFGSSPRPWDIETSKTRPSRHLPSILSFIQRDP